MIIHTIEFKEIGFIFNIPVERTISVSYETNGDEITIIQAKIFELDSVVPVTSEESLAIITQWLSAPDKRVKMLKAAARYIEQLKADSKTLSESQANDHYGNVRHACTMARRYDRDV